MALTTLKYDIMVGGRFLCRMQHRYLACFPLDLEKMILEIFERRPSLRDKRFVIATDSGNWTVEPADGLNDK